MSADVGADVESICSKCGDVWHVVVAKVEDRIAKVQCKECGATHRHRPPGGQAPAVKKKRVSRKATKQAETAAAPSVEPDLSRPVQRYRIDGAFEPGDRIDHPTFGDGVVQSSVAPGKIEVAFAEGRKVLASAKPAPTLEPGGRAGPGPAAEDSGS